MILRGWQVGEVNLFWNWGDNSFNVCCVVTFGGADKGILGAVFGIGSIFEESKADPVDGPVVPQIEGFKIGRYGRYFPSVR